MGTMVNRLSPLTLCLGLVVSILSRLTSDEDVMNESFFIAMSFPLCKVRWTEDPLDLGQDDERE